eukprot:4499188-Amphidinium_carterae.1
MVRTKSFALLDAAKDLPEPSEARGRRGLKAVPSRLSGRGPGLPKLGPRCEFAIGDLSRARRPPYRKVPNSSGSSDPLEELARRVLCRLLDKLLPTLLGGLLSLLSGFEAHLL